LIGGDYSPTGVLWFLARAGGKGREGKRAAAAAAAWKLFLGESTTRAREG